MRKYAFLSGLLLFLSASLSPFLIASNCRTSTKELDRKTAQKILAEKIGYAALTVPIGQVKEVIRYNSDVVISFTGITPKDVPGIDRENKNGPKYKLLELLDKSGIIIFSCSPPNSSNDGSMSYTLGTALTDLSKKHILKIENSPFGKYDGGILDNIYKYVDFMGNDPIDKVYLKLCNRVISGITGIKPISDYSAEAEYEWKFEQFTPIGEPLINRDIDFEGKGFCRIAYLDPSDLRWIGSPTSTRDEVRRELIYDVFDNRIRSAKAKFSLYDDGWRLVNIDLYFFREDESYLKKPPTGAERYSKKVPSGAKVETNVPATKIVEGSGPETLLETYFRAASMKDTTTLSSIAIEPVALTHQSWKITSVSEEKIEPATLPDLKKTELIQRKKIEEHVAPVMEAEDALNAAQEELRAAQTDHALVAARNKVKELEAKYIQEREVHKALQKNYNDTKALVRAEETAVEFSLGVKVDELMAKHDMGGSANSRELDVEIVDNSMTPQKYRFYLKKYKLGDLISGKSYDGKWVIIRIYPLEAAGATDQSTPSLVRQTESELDNALKLASESLSERKEFAAPLGRNQSKWDQEQRAWREKTLRSFDKALEALDTALRIANNISGQEVITLISKWKANAKEAREIFASDKPFSTARSYDKQKKVEKEIRNYLTRQN